jgi:hypothetical protein
MGGHDLVQASFVGQVIHRRQCSPLTFRRTLTDPWAIDTGTRSVFEASSRTVWRTSHRYGASTLTSVA